MLGKHFEDKYVLNYWFAKLLHSSTVIGGMDEYTEIENFQKLRLESVFLESGKELTE